MGTIAVLIPLLTTILEEAPHLITVVEEIWKLMTQTTAPTADEQLAYDTALDVAHKAFQAP